MKGHILLLLLFIQISFSAITVYDYYFQEIYSLKNANICSRPTVVFYLVTDESDIVSNANITADGVSYPITSIMAVNETFYVVRTNNVKFPIGLSNNTLEINDIVQGYYPYTCIEVPTLSISVPYNTIPNYQYLLKDLIAYKITNIDRPLPSESFSCVAYGAGGTYNTYQYYPRGSTHFSLFQFNLRPMGTQAPSEYQNSSFINLYCGTYIQALGFTPIFPSSDVIGQVDATIYPVNNVSETCVITLDTSNGQYPYISYSNIVDKLYGFFLPVIKNLTSTTYYSQFKLNVNTDSGVTVYLYNQSQPISFINYNFETPAEQGSINNGLLNIIAVNPGNFMYIETPITGVNYNTYSEYNPRTITFLGKIYSLDFPYGVTSGNAKVLNYQIRNLFTSFTARTYININYYPLKSSILYTANGSPGYDTIPPYVLQFTTNNLNNTHMIVDIVVKDLTGVIRIDSPYYYNNKAIIFDNRDVIEYESGDMVVVYYEKIIPRSALNTNIIRIIDISGNIFSFNSDQNIKPIDSLAPIFSGYYPHYFDFISKITNFTFSNNDINTTNVAAQVKLFINFQGSDPYQFISITSCMDMKTADTIELGDQCHWNSILSVFECDMSIPQGTVTSSYCYYIFANGFYSSTTMSMFRGPSAVLRTFSDTSYKMPPVVSAVTPILSSTTLGYNIQIESQTNISTIEYLIVGENDIIGFYGVINVTNDSKNFDLITSEFSSGICTSQPFYIKELNITDVLGNVATTKVRENGVYTVDPLYSVKNSYTRVVLLCNSPVDTEPPEIANNFIFYPTLTEIKVAGTIEERTFTMTFQTQDTDSGINMKYIPRIYFEAVNEDPIYFLAQGEYNTTTKIASYNTTITLPYGYGLNQYIIISLFGISDNKNNFIGKNSIASFISQFENNPLIENSSIISNYGGVLTLYGKKFLNVDLVEFDYNDGNGFKSITNQVFIQHGTIIVVYGISYLNNGIFKVRVSNDNYVSNVFTGTIISVPITPPPTQSTQCLGSPVCGGPSKGTCTADGCVCKDGYAGEDCLSQIVIVTPTINNTSPTFTTNITKEVSLSSLISLVSLSEITPTNQSKFKLTFDKWIFTDFSSNDKKEYQYYLNFTKGFILTHLYVKVQWFSSFETIEFAGQNITMYPSTLKYTITMTPFGFSSSLNHIQFEFNSVLISHSHEEVCSTHAEHGESGHNTDYSKLSINNYSLCCKFIKVGLIDNRPSLLKNTFILPNSSSLDEQSSTILVDIPHYESTIIIDPDFSVLLESADSDKYVDNCHDIDDGLSKSQLAGIIVGSIVLGFVFLALVFVVLKKRLLYTKLGLKIRSIKLKAFN